MSGSSNVQQLNQELANKLIEEAQRNPQPACAGRFVGIANGQVVVATDDLNELVRRLHEVEPDPGKTFCVELNRDSRKPSEPQEAPTITQNPIWQLNNAASDRIIEEVKRNPQSPYVNKKIGIVNGQVVVVADDWDDVVRELQRVEPDPMKTFVFDTAVDYDEVIEILGIL
jgi:uncharacterized protein YlzI (FlbEa/FlbD family)